MLEDVTLLLSVPSGDAPPPVVPDLPVPAVGRLLGAAAVVLAGRRRRTTTPVAA